ncbi:MAG: 6-phosphofructokinase [Lachnospiraceae bacterium]
MNNLLVAQSGGPTAAINATVVGVLLNAYSSNQVDEVFGAINGIQGVLDEHFVKLRDKIKSPEDFQLLEQTPAAALGSCRLKLKDLDKDREQFQHIIEIFRKYEIKYFIYIGGNDSMDTVDKLSQYCSQNQITDITVVGAPKTIDNDLVGTDHCPGFGSAAKYIGITFAELAKDCHVYAMKAVTIVEVMGRNAGWLTAASALARIGGKPGPDLIYLCEADFDQDKFILDVKAKLETKNDVLIAISEGIKDKNGQYISEQVQSGAVDAFGHSYISGSAKMLEALVREAIGCKVRTIELSLLQRCAGHIASAIDIQESKMLGMKACQCAVEGKSGMMASITRTNSKPYEISITAVPVNKVSNLEKKVPMSYMNEECNDVTQEMMDYLVPLIQGENSVLYEDGIPRYSNLY